MCFKTKYRIQQTGRNAYCRYKTSFLVGYVESLIALYWREEAFWCFHQLSNYYHLEWGILLSVLQSTIFVHGQNIGPHGILCVTWAWEIMYFLMSVRAQDIFSQLRSLAPDKKCYGFHRINGKNQRSGSSELRDADRQYGQ